MRPTYPLFAFIALIFFLAACKKNTSTPQIKPSTKDTIVEISTAAHITAADSTIIRPAKQIPYTDTFSGPVYDRYYLNSDRDSFVKNIYVYVKYTSGGQMEIMSDVFSVDIDEGGEAFFGDFTVDSTGHYLQSLGPHGEDFNNFTFSNNSLVCSGEHMHASDVWLYYFAGKLLN